MLVHIVYSSRYVTKELPDGSLNVGNLFDGICVKDDKSSFFILCNGRKVGDDIQLEDGKTYHIVPRLEGGKGGFGSMLRAIGAQIEKTTSREACRDLSGRRMRDINNEKKLKEWLAKEADREQEKEQRRQERHLKRQSQPQHKFDDTQYHEQRAKMQEDLQDAVSKGLKRTHKKETKHHNTEKKVKKTAGSSGISKTEWIGVDIDSDESSSSSDNEANPVDPRLQSGDGSSCSKDDTVNCASSSCSSHESMDAVTDVAADHIQDSHQTLPHHCALQTMKESNADTQPPMQEIEVKDSNEPVDLDNYSSSNDLAQLGLERLKNALMLRGLKCGGTLEERADRLFSVKGLSSDQIDPSLYAKSKGKGKKSK